MKILQVIPYFDWSLGGPTRVVYEISKKLSERGHEVTIYTTNVGRKHPLKDDERILLDNVEIHYFKCLNNYIANTLKLHISTPMQTMINRNIKNFDIVHIHEGRSIPHIYTWYYANKFNIPYIVQSHGSLPKNLFGQGPYLALSKFVLDPIIWNKIYSDAFKVIASTSIEGEQYKMIGIDGNKIEIVPNGIDLVDFDHIALKGRFRNKYSLAHNKIILFLGRINKIKGLDLLVDAFVEVMKYDKTSRLVIVGPDDGFLAQLKNKIKDLELDDYIIFTGPLYGDDKLSAYIDSDVYVLPSLYECFSMTILEACSFKVPIVTTNRCGISNVINGQVGYAVEPDKQELANAIVNILSNDQLRSEFKERCIPLLTNNFGWNHIVSTLESIYSSASIKS